MTDDQDDVRKTEKQRRNEQMKLSGGTAVVTGAGTGIGRALALGFAREGARVVCCGRREAPLQATVEKIRELRGEGLAIPTDVTKWDQVQAMVRRAVEAYGRIDLLFNNAGSFGYVGPLWRAEPDEWWHDVEVNLLGTMQCCRAVLPHMMERDSGIILNMDGGGGSNGPNPGGISYGSSKAAILRLTESLARELETAGSSVRVFAMMPGFVRTEMTESLIRTPDRAQWQSGVRSLMGSSAQLPPDACLRATLELLRIEGPELNGRIMYPDFDYERIGKNKKEIQRNNLYVLRFLTLDGPLGEWPEIDAE
jgi:NAD(P)-dependent dehydrogenase (short-subunit alcohol dehydrogenase family)